MKLFAAVLGGRADGCNTELHDVVFAVSETIESAYPIFIQKWFGSRKRLHLDSYIELTHVDGHDVHLSKQPSDDNQKKLFFVNFGMYKENYFGEHHETKFYIGKSKTDVLQRAKFELGLNSIQPHCDDNIILDDMINVVEVDHYYLHLQRSTTIKKLIIRSGYKRLDLIYQ